VLYRIVLWASTIDTVDTVPTAETTCDEDHSTKKKNKKKNKTFVSGSSSFVGECEEIKDHVYIPFGTTPKGLPTSSCSTM
jgi:hypothetical protein